MNLEHLNSYPAAKVRALFGVTVGALSELLAKALPELVRRRQVERTQRPDRRRAVGAVVYLYPADKCNGPVCRPSQTRLVTDGKALLVLRWPHPSYLLPCRRLCGRTMARQAISPCPSRSRSLPHTPVDCGHGGTRNRRTSLKLQTWSVSPAASAGAWGRQRLAEPIPLVGSGCGKGRRKEAWGRQKL